MSCCPSGFSYGAPVCVALSTGEPAQYKTKVNADQSITYVDSAGVESSSLPAGSSVINCNQISWVANQPASDGQELPIGVDCDNAPAMKTFDACVKSAVEAGTAAVVAAINGRPDYTAQLTSIGDTLTAMKSDTAAINTGVASSLVLLQAIVDKPDPTPVDLQPVLDKLDELIALETTENSTLVDVKNQLIAANVTLSHAETLLTHIDADMHDVVAKLQSALNLLTSLQTLLTTIDGRIAAIKNAITTADANNVSALNAIRAELRAINVNTDTLEALITAGNVLLRAIASNTDGVEGLLTEIRDLPVTDSWFLLYDMVKDTVETSTPLDAWSTTGGVTAFGHSLDVTSDGTATITVKLPKPATQKRLGFRSLDGLNGVSIFVNGGLVQNPASALFYTYPDGKATIKFVFSGFVGDIIQLITFNNDGSKGGCKPFIRRIVDNVVKDTELDLTTPYTAGDEVRASCPDAQTEPACTCSDELQALQTSVDSIAALFAKKNATPTYSYRTAAYVVQGGYKSLTVTFINEGKINGMYAPAGYSFSHPREIDVSYQSNVMLDGTRFAVWEDR